VEKLAVTVAFILIRAKSGSEQDILDALDELEEVTEAHFIYGEWDIITKVEVNSLPELNTLVIRIREIPGVQQTSTLVVG